MSDRERLHPSLCNTVLCGLYLKIRSEEGRCFLLKPVNSRAQPLLILSPSSDLISFQFLTFCYTETQESSYKVLSCRLENHPPTPHRTAQCHKLSWLLHPQPQAFACQNSRESAERRFPWEGQRQRRTSSYVCAHLLFRPDTQPLSHSVVCFSSSVEFSSQLCSHSHQGHLNWLSISDRRAWLLWILLCFDLIFIFYF